MGKFKMKPPFPPKGQSKPHAYNLGSKSIKDENENEFTVIKVELDVGIAGEANNDGTIFVSEDASPARQAYALKEELKHQQDMKTGKLGYNDNEVIWNGNSYPRSGGKILWKGKWLKEGDGRLGWEKSAKNRAYNA